MKQRKYGWSHFFFSLMRYWWLVAIAGGAVAIAVTYKSCQTNPPAQLTVVKNTRIDLTPEQVQSVRNIGEWEFMSVSTEEFVEWHRQRTFGSDHLVRIYSGTLRLGIDMAKADTNWFTSLPDSVAQLRLPHRIARCQLHRRGPYTLFLSKRYGSARSLRKDVCPSPKCHEAALPYAEKP